MAEERVQNPKHYNSHHSGIEAIELCQQLSFNAGNAVKYLFRDGHKQGVPAGEDLRKALFYLRAELRRVDGMGDDVLAAEQARYVASAALADRIKASYHEKAVEHDALSTLLWSLYPFDASIGETRWFDAATRRTGAESICDRLCMAVKLLDEGAGR